MPRRRRPGQHLFRQQDLPAPIGINAVDPASEFTPAHAIHLVNCISGTLGLQPRPGTKEHATNVGTSQPAEVRSLLSYHGSVATRDRFFGLAHDGIYDVTAGGSTPSRVLAFGTDNANSGRGNATAVTTAADRYLLYADEANGYQLYTESTDTWAAGSTTGVSAAALAFVVQWKNRVWFVERDSSRAWYLGLGSISGAATKFDFGPLFRMGGRLAGLYTWTVDGGNGADDFLVAVSTSGDVVLFGGTDPVAADFGQLGDWFLGGFPAGRRLGVQFGGDMLLLSVQGVISLQKLVSGQLVSPDVYETRNIRPLIVAAMVDQKDRIGWEMNVHPQANFLLVNSPGVPGLPQEQFVMPFATKGWSRLRDLDILCTAVWQGRFFFGTRDGRVMESTGFVDNVKLGGDTSAVRQVLCFWLGGYILGSDGVLKKPAFLKAHFITHGINPDFTAVARYEFDLTEPSELGVAVPAVLGSAFVWDQSNFDEAFWPALQGLPFTVVTGLVGFGHDFAIGGLFSSPDYCVLAQVEVAWEEGGPL